MSPTIFETIRARIAERVSLSDDTLVSAANKVAADENVDHLAVEHALREQGETLESFERLVELARKRREWRNRVDRGNTAQKSLDKLTATFDREAEEFAVVHRRWIERSADLQEQRRVAENAVVAGSLARGELVRPQNVPGMLGKQLVAAHEELAAASTDVSRLGRELRETRDREKSERGWADHKRTLNMSTPAGDAEDHTRRADRAAARAAELVVELKAATDREAEASAVVARLEARAIKT